MGCPTSDEETPPPMEKRTPLKKSVSTFGFTQPSNNLNLREAKSFTGNLQDLRTSTANRHPSNTDYYLKMLSEPPGVKDTCITKEVSSDKIFVVNHGMLNYRGKQYSMSDIATRWKKDCRMWFWKGSVHKRNKSVGEIRDKIHALKLLNSSEICKRFM